MTWRPLLLATGIVAAGAFILRRPGPRPSMKPALPRAGQPVMASTTAGAGDEVDPAGLPADLPLRSLQAGMPADMHGDADRARPGFADYSRGT